MLIADIMALVVPSVTDLLRRARAGAGTRTPQPMFPTIIALRNDRVVATVTTPRRAATLGCAEPLAIGLAPDALVLAAEARLDDTDAALTYAVMTRERQARWVLQEIREVDGEVRLSVPVDGGEPPEPETLQALAQAIAQRPVDVTRVARQDKGGIFGQDPWLPAEQGRVVVDAGAVSAAQQQVAQLGGRALYLARSAEAGRLALQAGLPRDCLLSARDVSA